MFVEIVLVRETKSETSKIWKSIVSPSGRGENPWGLFFVFSYVHRGTMGHPRICVLRIISSRHGDMGYPSYHSHVAITSSTRAREVCSTWSEDNNLGLWAPKSTRLSRLVTEVYIIKFCAPTGCLSPAEDLMEWFTHLPVKPVADIPRPFRDQLVRVGGATLYCSAIIGQPSKWMLADQIDKKRVPCYISSVANSMAGR